VWPWIAALREGVRRNGGQLTYAQIGAAFGISDTRVKQLLGGWEQVKTPDGWRMKPPTKKESNVADGVEGADEGERG
jgi:hypothetical protein